ncbi:hypothetical protein TRVL_01544 [Trypanosoma vivax]|nr:hypothetical protein TRVL_01544 [Trypanosoma vivax]
MSFRFEGRWVPTACAAAAALVLPGAVYLARSAYQAMGKTNNSSTPSGPPAEWDVDQVLQWLRSLGVSAAVVKNFMNHQVNGSVLLLLDESDIRIMASMVRDVVLIREGLRELRAMRNGGSPPTAAPDSTPPTAGPGPNASAVEEENECIKSFLETAEAIFATLCTNSYRQASPRSQKGMRDGLRRQYAAMLNMLETTSPETQAQLAPINQKLETLFENLERNKCDKSSTAALPPQELTRFQCQLKGLHDMVNNFLQVLDSTGDDIAKDPRLQSLRERVGEQIDGIINVVSRLPPQYGEELMNKCKLILQKLGRLPAVPTLPVGQQSEHMSRAPGTSPAEGILKRLQQLFAILKSPAMVVPDVRQRLALISRIREELSEISQAATVCDADAAHIVRRLVEQVSSILDQMEMLSNEEPRVTTAAAHDNRGNAEDFSEQVASCAAPAATPPCDAQGLVAAGMPIDEVTLQLERIFSFINSPTFEALSPEERRHAAQQRLVELQHIEARCLQTRELHDVLELIVPLKEILQIELEEEVAEEGEEEPTPLFLNISSHLRQMKLLLESEGFKSASVQKKRSTASWILPRLQKIRSTVSQLRPRERIVVEGLIRAIKNILRNMAAERATQEETQSEPSELLSRIEVVLSTVQSEEFRNTSMEQRGLIASKLVSDLGSICEGCHLLGDVAVPLLNIAQNLQQRLRGLVRLSEAPGTLHGAASGVDGDIRMNISYPITSENLSKTASEVAGEEVEEEEEEEASGCVMDEEDGGSRGAASKCDQLLEERRGLFLAVRDIVERLQGSNSSAAKLSREELEHLHALLAMVDSVGLATVEESELRDQFELQLRLASDRTAATLAGVSSLVTGHGHEPQRGREGTLGVQDMIRNAEREIRENPPQNESQLQPYLSFIESIKSGYCAIPPESQEALRSLQASVLALVRSFYATEVAQESEQVHRPNEASDGVSGERALALDEHLGQLLFDISHRLRDGPIPPDLLDHYALLLDCLEEGARWPAQRDAIKSVREQIKLQHIAQMSESEDEETEGEEMGEGKRKMEGKMRRDFLMGLLRVNVVMLQLLIVWQPCCAVLVRPLVHLMGSP